MPWRTTEPHLTTPHAVGVPTSFLQVKHQREREVSRSRSNPHTPVGDPAVCERFKSPQESQSHVAAKERTTAGKKYPRGHCLHAELIMSSRPLTHMHMGFEEDVVQKKKQHKI
eukprot:contig_27471_g6757